MRKKTYFISYGFTIGGGNAFYSFRGKLTQDKIEEIKQELKESLLEDYNIQSDIYIINIIRIKNKRRKKNV